MREHSVRATPRRGHRRTSQSAPCHSPRYHLAGATASPRLLAHAWLLTTMFAMTGVPTSYVLRAHTPFSHTSPPIGKSGDNGKCGAPSACRRTSVCALAQIQSTRIVTEPWVIVKRERRQSPVRKISVLLSACGGAGSTRRTEAVRGGDGSGRGCCSQEWVAARRILVVAPHLQP